MPDFLWGAPGAYADAVPAASFASLANGSIAVGAAIDNTTLRRMWMEVSFVSTVALAMTAGAHLAVYVLPQLHDGAAYPTNNVTGAALPGPGYVRGSITMPTGTLAPAGSIVIPVPYGIFKVGIGNRLGAGFSNSTTAHVCRCRLVLDAAV